MGALSGKTVEINVLSVQQPWADLILMGEKWCENRTWDTSYRGVLFLHASKWDVEERNEWEALGMDLEKESPGGCHTGAIVGFVTLYGCMSIENLESIYEKRIPPGTEELANMLEGVSNESWQYASGPVCWIMCSPKFLETPIFVKGKLRLWKHTVEKSQLKAKKSAR